MRNLIFFTFLMFSPVAVAGTLVDWPDVNVPPEGNDFVAIAAGDNCCGVSHKLALKTNGEIIAWGDNWLGQCDVPEPNNYVAIACGFGNSLAIRPDGSIAAWGRNIYGESNPPAGNDYVAIAAGNTHGIALKSNGSLVAWGKNNEGQCDVPDGTFVAIAAGHAHNLALKSDGSLASWGENRYGECNVPDDNDFVFVACGNAHSLAIKQDGTLLAWGSNEYGQCEVADGNYIAAAGGYHTIAIKTDGSLAAWGINDCGEVNVPGGTGFVALAACGHKHLALTSDETASLIIASEPNNMLNLIPPTGEHGYYYGQRIFISAVRSPQCPYVYNFDHWTGDVSDPCATSQYIIMDTDKTITAHYIADTRVCGDECHPILEGDRNEDCYIDFEDFAIYAAQWLYCTHPDCD